MLKTRDLLLDKAKASDWEAMYRNVWSHPESARYMHWDVTTNEADAKARILRTIEFQKTHDAYLVYDAKSGQAIGFAGVSQLEPGVYEETGICLGPDFTRKGYGKQILACLMDHSRVLGAKAFRYSVRAENAASRALAHSFGFQLQSESEEIDPRDGSHYILQRYIRTL